MRALDGWSVRLESYRMSLSQSRYADTSSPAQKKLPSASSVFCIDVTARPHQFRDFSRGPLDARRLMPREVLDGGLP